MFSTTTQLKLAGDLIAVIFILIKNRFFQWHLPRFRPMAALGKYSRSTTSSPQKFSTSTTSPETPCQAIAAWRTE
jgi:hypothetical protein